MAKNTGKIRAFAYMRTSTAANVGPDKDSDKRQRSAITAFAKANGYEIEAEFYDAAVSGSDAIAIRPQFLAMLNALKANGTRTILVESPDRFARDLVTQLTGHDFLKREGFTLIPRTAPDYFTEDTPTARLVRQVLGAISEFEKANIAAKLKGARERRRAQGFKCGGRLSHAEKRPEVVTLAKQLRRKRRGGRRLSLREISAELASLGLVNELGQPYAATSIRNMLAMKVQEASA
jgi:DNA invertase Pin-like site-specific DNA recombinase